jgi:hypothetical protein
MKLKKACREFRQAFCNFMIYKFLCTLITLTNLISVSATTMQYLLSSVSF